MASSKPTALVFLAMALMVAACAQAQAPAPAPAPSQNACPPGFKNILDLTDFLRGTGRELITEIAPGLLPTIQGIVGIIPHTGLQLCVCFVPPNVPFFVQCIRY
ncbi:hypothetical protein U9M48_000849 [Paspalum notatum var. saurae]|uniref:Uncharacterized protein n=1 Tax=Paspalum notatum var. saurae TaxID=547442 RepID=A0AAQ3PM87_PASNO